MDAEAQAAAEAMARYCGGETAAFHRLYELLAPRILAYLTARLGEKAAAEDALQLTFLKVHEARAAYVLGANPIPWIYTIAHRTSLDELRKRKRSRVKLTKDGELRGEPEAHLTGVANEAYQPPAEGPVSTAGALAALETLPEGQREALVLTKVHGRSHAEAAHDHGNDAGRNQAARPPRLRHLATDARRTTTEAAPPPTRAA